MTETRLLRRDPARNMARFYVVRVVPTLFGEWAVLREWGRIGSPGTLRTEWCGSEPDAAAACARIVAAKTRRGYRPSAA